MTDSPAQRVPWRRLTAESLAVILSILLAFAIDAWWDGHQEDRRARDLMSGLLEEFQSTRPGLEERVALARRMAQGTGGLLALAQSRLSGGGVTVPDSLVIAALGAPTFEPVTNALDAALASGEIELIGNDGIRAALAHWRNGLADTREDELEVRRVTNEQLIPLLGRWLDLGPHLEAVVPWSGGDPYGPGRLIAGASRSQLDGHADLPTSTELASILALRRFWVEFSAADLESLLEVLDRSVGLLREELGR